MKQLILLISLTFFLWINLFGQIRINNLNVYASSNTIDSFSIQGIASLIEYVDTVIVSPLNDSCNTLEVIVSFKGCNPALTISYDTTISLALPGNRLNVITKLDTFFRCGFPSIPTYTDTAIWDNCSSVGLEEVLNGNIITIFPNPSSDFIRLDNPEKVKFTSIEIYSINGSLMKRFSPQEQLFGINELKDGIYFLRLDTKEGLIVKKVMIVK